MTSPAVSFVVPCYKLAHYLPECVNSILAQTFRDFEIIIMDDCSPDDTPAVARSFNDPRITHVRNEPNLGHVRNYNKGVSLARGRYIWLISADDRLSSPRVLERYVNCLEANPRVAYAFCPAIALEDGRENGIVDWSSWPGATDRILGPAEVLRRAAHCCSACSPTAMYRRDLLAAVGGYLVDLPRTNDWFFWAALSLRHDAAWFAEPMVCYRLHAANMEKTMEQEQAEIFHDEMVSTRWRIKAEAAKAGVPGVQAEFQLGLALIYTSLLVQKRVNDWPHGRTWAAVEQEVRAKAAGADEAAEILRLIQARLPAALATGWLSAGLRHHEAGRLAAAAAAFRSAAAGPRSLKARAYLAAVQLQRACGFNLVASLKNLRRRLHRAPAR
ncbi:MAG: glycosyltransferase family 2 protein [Verrucomicrobia bacterium]|nr:glycosyltransferase family 2 protein [Verrucomicrobiota bacterium]